MIRRLPKMWGFKSIAIGIIVAYLSMIPVESGYTQTLPAPGQMVQPSGVFQPSMMLGLQVNVKDPFNLQFIFNDGDERLSLNKRQEEYTKLVRYFLASLGVPNQDMWVNLSPEESDRIIPDNFSQTEMGRDLLAQDYLLKQFTSSLMDPESALGKKFWNEIYEQAHAKYGTTDIPIDTFNKVWITVDEADIFQRDNTAFVVKSHLKVMVEEDFIAADHHQHVSASDVAVMGSASDLRNFVTDAVRNIIIPVIEKEVNEGEHFALVRQAYNAMILATWYKKTLKDTLLAQAYTDQSKTEGIEINDPEMKDRIYQQYLEAYQIGVFDFIKEEMDPFSDEIVPRKYFSGGIVAIDSAMINTTVSDFAMQSALRSLPGQTRVAGFDLLTNGYALKVDDLRTQQNINPEKVIQGNDNAMAALEKELADVEDDAMLAKVKLDIALEKLKGLVARTKNKLNESNFLTSTVKSLRQVGLTVAFTIASATSLLGAGTSDQEIDVSNAARATIIVEDIDVSNAARAVIVEEVDVSNAGRAIIIDEDIADENIEVDGTDLNQTDNDVDPEELLELETITAPVGDGQVTDRLTGETNDANDVELLGWEKTSRDLTVYFGSDLDGSYQTIKAGSYVLKGSPPPDGDVSNKIRPDRNGNIILSIFMPDGNFDGSGDGNFQLEENDQVKEAMPIEDVREDLQEEYSQTVKSLARTNTNIQNVEDTVDSLGESIESSKTQINALQKRKPVQSTTVEKIAERRAALKKSLDARFAPGAQGLNIQAGINYNVPYASLGSWMSDSGAVVSVVPAVPFRSVGELWNMSLGLSNSSVQTTSAQVTGPLFFADGVLQLSNQFKTLPIKKNGILWDLRQGNAVHTLWETVGVNTNGFEGFDDQGNLREGKTHRMGLAQNTEAFFDNVRALVTRGYRYKPTTWEEGRMGFMPDPGDNEALFQYLAANNKDENIIPVISHQVIDATTRFQQNKYGGFDVVQDPANAKGVYDYRATVTAGYVIKIDPKTNKATISRVFQRKNFIPEWYAKRLAKGKSWKGPLVETVPSFQDLDKESMLARGYDAQGRTVYGVLRNNWGGIVRFITDPQELNNISTVTDKRGRQVQFMPGKSAKKKGVVRSYIRDEINGALKAWGLTPNKAYKNGRGERALDDRPQLQEVPGGLRGLLANGSSLIYEPAPFMKNLDRKINKEGKFGMVFLNDAGAQAFNNNGQPVALENWEGVMEIKWAYELAQRSGNESSSGITRLKNGRFKLEGFDQIFTLSDTVVMKDGIFVGIPDFSVHGHQDSIKRNQEKISTLNKVIAAEKGWGTGYNAKGESIYYPAQDANGNSIQSPEGIQTAAAADVVGQDFYIEQADGQTRRMVIQEKMMVRVEDGVVVEFFEAGKKTTEARMTVIETLSMGGAEVYNASTSNYEIYAVDNKLSKAQLEAGIKPARELVKMVVENQVAMGEGMQIPKKPMAKKIDVQTDAPETMAELRKDWRLVFFNDATTQWIPRTMVEANDVLKDFRFEISSIERLDINGDPEAWMVPMWKAGYAEIEKEVLKGDGKVSADDFFKNNVLLVAKDKTVGFIAIQDLTKADVREEVLNNAFELLLKGSNGIDIGRIYFGAQPSSYRIEKFSKDGPSLIYPLFDYRKDSDGNYQLDATNEAISEVRKLSSDIIAQIDPDYKEGERGVLKIDYQGRNATIDIFATDSSKNSDDLKQLTPIRVIDLLSESVLYNDSNGHARHQVRMGQDQWDLTRDYVENITRGEDHHREHSVNVYEEHSGMDMVLDGKFTKNVLTISRVTEQDGEVTVDYINIMDAQLGDYVLAGRTIYDQDGHTKVHYTGHVLLPDSIEEGRTLLDAITGVESFKKKDEYFYNDDVEGSFAYREVFERRDNDWILTRTIRGLQEVEIGKNGIDYKRFIAVDEVQEAMEALGIDERSVLQFTPVDTVEGLQVVDYKQQFDRKERVVLSAYEYEGKILKIVVSTGFDEVTGEVTSSVVLNHNYEVFERLTFLDESELEDAEKSNVAGDIFNQERRDIYKEVTGENLLEGLERLGIHEKSRLGLIQVEKRLTNKNGSFNNQWNSSTRVLLPRDNTGRSLAQILDNDTLNINAWWMHDSISELENNMPEVDSIIPSPNLSPFVVKLHHDKEHEMQSFNNFETVTFNNNSYPGMTYTVDAEFLESVTYDVPTGRVLSETSRQGESLLASAVNTVSDGTISTGRTSHYDPRANWSHPEYDADQNGEIIRRYKEVEYDSQGNSILRFKEKDSVFGWWKEKALYFDKYGEKRDPVPEIINKPALWTSIGLILLYPFTVIARAFQSSRKRAKGAKKVREMEEGRLYSEDIQIVSQQRFARKVLQSLREDPALRRLDIKGDPESLFLFNLNAIYVLGVSRFIKANGINPDDYEQVVNTDELAEWDQYAIDVGRYLAEELARSASDVVWDKVLSKSLNEIISEVEKSINTSVGISEYQDQLLEDEGANEVTLKLLHDSKVVNLATNLIEKKQEFIDIQKQIRSQLKAQDKKPENDLKYQAFIESKERHLERLQKRLMKVARSVNIDDKVLVDVDVGSNASYAQVGRSDQQIWDKMETYLATQRDKLAYALDDDFKIAEARDGGLEENGSMLYGGHFDRVRTSIGIITLAETEDGVENFYYQFQEFLVNNDYDQAPNRIIKKSDDSEIYVKDGKHLKKLIKDGQLSRQEVHAYVRDLDKLSWKTFFGKGIRALHPILLDGTIMPRLVLGAIGIGALTLGKVSLLGLIGTSIFGISAGWLLGGAAIILGITALVDFRNISKNSQLPAAARWGVAAISAVAAGVVFALPQLSVGVFFLKAAIGFPLILETLTLLFWKRSNLGLNAYYHYRESINPGRLAANVLIWGGYATFMGLTMGFGWVAYGWFATQLGLGHLVTAGLGLGMFGATVYFLNSGLWTIGRFLMGRFAPQKGAPKQSDLSKQWADLDQDAKMLVDYVGPLPGSVSVLNKKKDVINEETGEVIINEETGKPKKVDIAPKEKVENLLKELMWLVNDGSPSAIQTLKGIRENAQDIPEEISIQEFIEQHIKPWLLNLYEKESEARVSLYVDDQLLAQGEEVRDGDIPLDLRIVYNSEQERQQLIFAKEINQALSLMNPYEGGVNPFDGGVSLMGLAHMLRDTTDDHGVALGEKTMFLFTSNFPGDVADKEAVDKFLRLFGHISGADVDINFTDTTIGMKSGAMNALKALPQDYEESKERAEKLNKVRRLLILDRNANALDLRSHIKDVSNSLNNPELAIMVAHRNTTNTRRYIGVQNYLVEGGQGDALKGFNEKVGTGWQNNMGVYSWDALSKLSNPDLPRKSFTKEMQKLNQARSMEAGFESTYADEFGMVGFAENAVGISEDYWAVLQQTHMLAALGYDPQFALSESIHHKRRETFSNFELAGAVPRWAGGRNQTISSFMNQSINDIGPEAYVEREAVRNTGRHYVGLPLALVTLIALPLSVVFGFNPFAGLWLGLAGIGIVFNQSSRLHGWGLMIDDSGFFFGTARFFAYSFRDMTVFSTRVMLETLAFLNSYLGLTFMFKVSGGGGDAHSTNGIKELKKTPFSFVSFKSVLAIGVVTAGLMIFSTISGLTVAHIAMMFLPMLWGINILTGLFLSENVAGKPVLGGVGDNIAATSGVLSALGYAATVYFFKSAILGLGAYGVAMFGLYKLAEYFNAKGNGGLLRLVSQFNRYFIRTVSGALLFALVPSSAFIKFNVWPNVTLVLAAKQFFMGIGAVIGAGLTAIGGGYGIGAIAKHGVTKQYDELIDKFWAVRDQLDDTTRIVISQRFHQVNIFIDQLGYKRAKKALDEIEEELRGVARTDRSIEVESRGVAESESFEFDGVSNSYERVGSTELEELGNEVDEAMSAVKELNEEISDLAMKADELREQIAIERNRLAEQESVDNASSTDEVGGISFNEQDLTINIEVDGEGMPLPLYAQDMEMLNIRGLTPVIRSIEPMTSINMPAFSGLMSQ